MNEIPSLVYQIGGAGALTLLIIKEVRHWTTSLYNRKNGHYDDGGRSRQGERIQANETEISNMKDGFKEQRKENKEEHTLMKEENKTEHESMAVQNKAAHDEIKALIINGGKL